MARCLSVGVCCRRHSSVPVHHSVAQESESSWKERAARDVEDDSGLEQLASDRNQRPSETFSGLLRRLIATVELCLFGQCARRCRSQIDHDGKQQADEGKVDECLRE